MIAFMDPFQPDMGAVIGTGGDNWTEDPPMAKSDQGINLGAYTVELVIDAAAVPGSYNLTWYLSGSGGSGTFGFFTVNLVEAAQTNVVLNTNDSGAGSLRQAVADSVPGGTILFTNTLSGSTILLTGGEILVDKDLTIDASALPEGIILDGQATSRVMQVMSNTVVVLDSLVLSNGFAPGAAFPYGARGSGLHADRAVVTLSNCGIAGNHAVNHGGGIYNYAGTLTLNGTTVRGNTADLRAGGVFNSSGGTIILNNTTLSGNSATNGGAIYNTSGTVLLNNTTLSENSATSSGGGLYNSSGTLHITNSIIAGNSAATNSNIHGSISSGANNLTSDVPLLALLGDYGGPTQTMPPLPGSPAIDAGITTSLTSDQRGAPRYDGLPDIGAVEVQPGMVLNNDDSGLGSLRNAIEWALPGDTITFTNTLSGSTISLTSGEILVDRDLAIDASALPETVILDGQATSRVVHVSSNTVAVLNSLVLSNGFAPGTASPFGGRGSGLYVDHAVVTLNNCALVDHDATVFGGGIYNYAGRLTLNDTTLSGNTAGRRAGGILNRSGGILTINNTTFSGNAATNGGGIFNSTGMVILNNATLFGNSATNSGGGIYNASGTLHMTNSIIAGNSAETNSNIHGSISSGANNLVDVGPLLAPLGDYGGPTQTMPPLPGSPAIDAGVATTLTTDQRGAPRLDGIPDIGSVEVQSGIVLNSNDSGAGSLRGVIEWALSGDTVTFTNTLSGSTIVLTSGQILVDKNLTIDASAIGGLTIDGNGIVTRNRIFEIAADTTNVLDSLIITGGWTEDGLDFTAPIHGGDGGGILNAGNLTMVNCTVMNNATGNGGDVLGSRAGFGGDGGGICNDQGTLSIVNSTISRNSTGDGGDSYRDPPYSDGGGNGGSGGGIWSYQGTVSIVNSTVSGNATGSGGDGDLGGGGGGGGAGGGIWSHQGTVSIVNSTVSGNATGSGGDDVEFGGYGGNGGDGGGIFNSGDALALDNSTVWGNSTGAGGAGDVANGGGGRGGGIRNAGFMLTLGNVTVSGNSAGPGGVGGGIYGGSLNVTNSIIAGNSSETSPNIQGSLLSGSHNLTNGNPHLAPLGDYGGLTQTAPPLPESPAIDAGLDTGSLPAADQRGMPRILAGGPATSPKVDIGAVEYSIWLAGADLSGVDTNNLYLPPETVYDSATVFPSGFDPVAAGMMRVMSQEEIDGLVAQGETQGEANVTNNPTAYGLYTESAFQALALDRPFLAYNDISNTFTLTIGILQAPDLFTTFSNLTGFTTIPFPDSGEVDILFDPPNPDARFFEVYGTEPSP